MKKAVDDRLLALQGILDSDRPRSEIERLCIERQINDLMGEGANGLIWDEGEAQRAVSFCKLLSHWKGRQFQGKPFIPEPWQEHHIIAPLFGWKREDEFSGQVVRRYNEGYIEVPRKNGKSFLSSALASQGLLADGEVGPEVYSAASAKEQAGIVFTDAKRTLGASHHLSKRVRILQHHIECPHNNGILRAASSDYNILQGRGPSRVVLDELHAHKTSETYDAMIGGCGGRQDWMLISITTAGHDRSSICWERHEYAKKVMEGHVKDETFFAFIAGAEPEDDITDPQTWWKANPNLGVSVFHDFLKRQSEQAANVPSKQNEFKRVHLNQWTEQSVRWLPMDAWDACGEDFTIETVRHLPCRVGLDLANTKDVNAMSLIFCDNDTFYAMPYFWIPAESKDDSSESNRRMALNWAKSGLIATTEGDTADFDGQIPADIYRILSGLKVQEICYDPWGPAVALVQRLQSMGIRQSLFCEFRQSMGNFAAPTVEFERLVFRRLLKHNRNPVLRWMAANVSVKVDASGNMRPDKGATAAGKIDGIVASIMALGSWMSASRTKSVYESRGVLTL